MYRIMGSYNGSTEQIDEFDAQAEAWSALEEYQTAFGPKWILWVVK